MQPRERALRRVVAGLAALLLAAATVACQTQAGTAWGEEALTHYDDLDRIQRQGVGLLPRYLRPDMVLDVYGDVGVTARGSDEIVRWLASTFGRTIDEATKRRVFLDVGGSVVEWRFGPSTKPPGEERSDDLMVEDMAPNGWPTFARHPLAIAGFEPDYWPAELGAAQALVAAYLRAWSTEDVAAVGDLYAPGARVVDTLLQVELRGRQAIVSDVEVQRAAAGDVTLRQDEVADGGGPAIYLYWPDGINDILAHEFEVFVVYAADDGDGCPGRVVAGLQVSGGTIQFERRYHEVESVRRCFDTDRLPEGWWEGLEPVPGLEDEVTGTVAVGGQSIEIHNGTPALERMVRETLNRYEAVGLEIPAVESVSFDPDVHAAQCTADHNGLTIAIGDSAQVFVCIAEEQACLDDDCRKFTPTTELLMLHEFAHAWMLQHLTEPAQSAFLELMGTETWYSPDIEWGRRGVEQAAQVIAWGLMDEPIDAARSGGRSCGQLAQAFEVLTGATTPGAGCSNAGS